MGKSLKKSKHFSPHPYQLAHLEEAPPAPLDVVETLQQFLAQIEPVRVEGCATNMVFLDVPPAEVEALGAFLRERDILAAVAPRTRLVTHRDVSAAGPR